MKNILLTGSPGVGKTTEIIKLIGLLPNCGGFFTEEIKEGENRVGFRIVTTFGEEGVLAHIGLKSPYRLGRYHINLPDIASVAVKSISHSLYSKLVEYVIIDEIAAMELFSDDFRKIVISALDSEKKVVATIQKRSSDFLDKIRNRKDVSIIEITFSNRSYIHDDIMGGIIK